MQLDRILPLARTYWADIAWVVFIGLNLIAMRLLPEWQTVPFLIIWVSLTAIYGFRLWRLGSTILMVAVVALSTGGLIGWQVIRGQQDAEYLVEVPLLTMMFVVMVWHARRRQAAMAEMRRVSQHNLLLLDQQRQFLQDVSHELGTPITIALGHAELIEHATTDQAIAEDARVAVDELLRMRRLANRLLLLAATDGPAVVTRHARGGQRAGGRGPADPGPGSADRERGRSHRVRRPDRAERQGRRRQGHPGRVGLGLRHRGRRPEPDLRPVLPDRRRPQPGDRRVRPGPGGSEGDRGGAPRLCSGPQHGGQGLGVRVAPARDDDHGQRPEAAAGPPGRAEVAPVTGWHLAWLG